MSCIQVHAFQSSTEEAVFRVWMEEIESIFLECPTRGHLPWHWFYLTNNCAGKGWPGREKPGFGEARVDFIYHALAVWPWTWIFIIYVRLRFLICKRGLAGGNGVQNVLPCTLTGNTCPKEDLSLLSGHCLVLGVASDQRENWIHPLL